MAQANEAPASQPGITSNVAAALRTLQTHNVNVLNQAIAQLETAHEIQTELVHARAGYSQVSSDLRKAVDQNLMQTAQLKQSKDEIHSLNVRLNAARDQLLLLEKGIEKAAAEAAARERQLAATREAQKDRQIEALNSALQVANARITDLDGKLQVVASASRAAETTKPIASSNKALEPNTLSLRDLDQWLASFAKELDGTTTNTEETTASPTMPASTMLPVSSNNIDTPIDEPNQLSEESKNEISRLVKSSLQVANAEKHQILSRLKSLRAQYINVLDIARASVSRNLALEKAFKIIRDIKIENEAPVQNTPVSADTDVVMDEERTEAANAARQANNRRPSVKSATMSPLISSAISQPSTPSQSASTFGSVSPQRKRQRLFIGSATPEPLPRDDELYGLVKLIHTTYDIRCSPGEPKRLSCKACEARHKKKPDDYPLTFFDYDLDQKIPFPTLATAEQTRTRIRPWVAHLQEIHQKLYAGFMEKIEGSSRGPSIASSN